MTNKIEGHYLRILELLVHHKIYFLNQNLLKSKVQNKC